MMIYDNLLKIAKSQKRILGIAYSLLLTAYSGVLAQTISPDKNAVIHSKARVSTSNLADLDDPTKATISIKYEDGLGRHLQTIGYRQSPTMQDIVLEAFEYDGVGRRVKAYLPAPSYTDNGAFRNGLNTVSSSFYQDAAPFSQVRSFDNSPLNRPMTQYGAGQAWVSNQKYTEVLQNNNKLSDQIRLYRVDASGVASSSGYYPSGRMYKRSAYNEHRHKVIEFIDKQKNILERWVMDGSTGSDTTYMKTAYIYDDIGHLRYVVPPQAYDNASTVNVNTADFEQYIFAYRYDTRGRVIRKHLPNSGWSELVYDYLNRPVLEQSALQAPQNLWSFNKYDGFGRVIIKGELINSNSRAVLQGLFNNVATPYEMWQNGNYSNQSYPIAYNGNDIKQWFFYDHYEWIASDWVFNASLAYDATKYWPNAMGKATGSWARSPEDPNVLFYTVLYYDQRDRLMQSFQTHHKGGSQNWQKPIITNFQYNFAGEVINTKITYQMAGQPSITTLTTNEVDKAGRLLKVYHGINGIAPVEILRMTYDEIGRLSQKKIMPNGTYYAGGAKDYIIRPNPDGAVSQANTQDIARKAVILQPSSSIKAIEFNSYLAKIDANAQQGTAIVGLQTIDYQWHIRGGLRGINLDAAQNPVPKSSEGDLFSYKLDYESAGQWSGNIGLQTWANIENNATKTRAYAFTFDAASRLKSADFWGVGTENYSLPLINYNKNGSITKLRRYGKVGAAYGMVDNLTYTYQGNQVSQITDTQGSNNGNEFVQKGNAGYTYYADGSLKSDANEGISLIMYDTYLKQAIQVNLTDGRWYKNYYDGSGHLYKTVYFSASNAITETWEFIGDVPLILKNGQPYQMAIPDGRAVYVGGSWQYEFDIKDHLGSSRVSFKVSNGNQLEQTAKSDFEPFGLKLSTSVLNSIQNRWEMQGKASEQTFGLYRIDFGARTMNPLTVVWDRVDIMAEKYTSFSPYNYVLNNPIRIIDPDGKDIILYYKDNDGKNKTYDYTIGSKYTGKNQFIKDFYTAVNKLEQVGASQIIHSLEKNNKKVWIEQSKSRGSYSPNRSIIKWDSNMGVITNKGVILSPTSVLNHESDHALHHLQTGERHITDRKPDKDYNDTEERRVITGSEQQTSLKLGEIKKGEVTRTDHEGTEYQVTGPTSNIGVNDVIIKPAKKKNQ